MATKKKDNGNKASEVTALMAALPSGSFEEMELTALKVAATADIRELLATASVVVAGIPAPRSAAVEKACAGLTEACELTTRARTLNQAHAEDGALATSGARGEVVGLMKTITGIVALIASASVPEVAEEGRTLKIKVFGDNVEPSHLSTRALLVAMQEMEARLAAQPDLRALLVARVPEALLTQLRQATGRLAQEVGASSAWTPRVSNQALRKMLRERLGRLVKVLTATAELGDDEAALAVRKQLQPIVALGIAVAPRRPAAVEEDDEDEPVETPVVPAAPPAPTPDEPE